MPLRLHPCRPLRVAAEAGARQESRARRSERADDRLEPVVGFEIRLGSRRSARRALEFELFQRAADAQRAVCEGRGAKGREVSGGGGREARGREAVAERAQDVQVCVHVQTSGVSADLLQVLWRRIGSHVPDRYCCVT